MASVPSSLSAFSKCFQGVTILILGLLLLVGVNAQNRSDEVQALLEWRALILNEGGNNASEINLGTGGYWGSWNETDENPCAWVGVTCTTNFTVVVLDFSDWRLPRLQLLEQLSRLPDLRQLDLSQSTFITEPGPIPHDVGLLTGLISLDLSGIGFTGAIPANISLCTSLRYLSLEDNLLDGSIPPLKDLENLQVLVLSDNQLTGPFPKDLGELHGLVSVDLSDNKLDGTISISNITKLFDLVLDNNQFTEFEELLPSSMSSLQRLSVSGNQLRGVIPQQFTNWLNLKVLNMSGNKFSGSIPSGFSLLWNQTLVSLDFSRNTLTGNIPVDLLQPELQLRGRPAISLNLSHNLLNGSVSLNNGQFPLDSVVDLSYNRLSGFVQQEIFNLPSGIKTLWLHDNQLSGDIVKFLTHQPGSLNLMDLQLQNNRFTGDLSRVGNISPLLQLLDVSNNDLHMSTTQTLPDPLGALLQNVMGAGNGPSEFRAAGNNFSGTSLPTTCFPVTQGGSSIAILDLSDNFLTGEISGAVFNSTCLPQLQYLNLSNNDATGPLPESVITNPNLTVCDVSNNSLSGPLPVIQSSSRLYDPRFFAGNTGLCGYPLSPCPSKTSQKKPIVQWWVLFIIVVGSLIIALGSCLGATWRWRVYHKRHRQDVDLIKTLMERESTTLMSLRALKKATNNFAMGAQIGEGGFGTVYIGKLNDGTTVAIKRSKREGTENDKAQFLNEVKILSQVNHRYLVKLLGCCMENKIALLVFEYVSNGTLKEHLERKNGVVHLSWRQRLNIAVQTADALCYLHSGTTSPIYHRDVKSANILLDENLDAKVSDFGISRLAPISATHVSTVGVHGTMGYIDPEYYTSCQLTDKSDVYSFGVVLLELISAKPAIDLGRGEDETSLVHFAGPQIKKGDLEDLIDPALTNTYREPTGRGKKSLLDVGRVAVKCLDMRSKTRPSMNEVWKELQNLYLEYNGTSEHSGSINVDDNEGLEYHHMHLLSKSLSDYSHNFNYQNAGGHIQLSQLSP